jgi:hypothetical protein
MKSVEAMLIVDRLLTADSETLNLVAERLVNSNHHKADAFQFAINVEMHEMMLSYGFSEKIKEVA